MGMYGLVMTSVASTLGNVEKYEQSNEINQKILRESVRTRNMSYVRHNMYALYWNDKKQKGSAYDKGRP